jgi:hypothetical protein
MNVSANKTNRESDPKHSESIFAADRDIASPIFVFGQPLSGTPLLQKLINSTNVALLYGEHLGILRGIAESYFEFFRNDNVEKFCSTGNDSEIHSLTLEALRNSNAASSLSNGFTAAQVDAAYKTFVHRLINPCGLRLRWGFVEIRYCAGKDFVVPFLHDLFPQAQFVFLTRHPVPQLAGVLQSRLGDYDPLQAASAWGDQVRCMFQYCRDFPDHAVLTRVEDITRADEFAILELFTWLKLPFSDKQREILRQARQSEMTPARQKPVDEAASKAFMHVLSQAIAYGCNIPEGRALYGAMAEAGTTRKSPASSLEK